MPFADKRSLRFWLLFLPLIPQALWVRHTVPRFGGAPGPRSGSAGRGETVRLSGLGDSIIAGVGCRSLETALTGCTARALAARLNESVTWKAFGEPGLDTRAIRQCLLPGAELEGSDFVLISTGVNDATSLTGPAKFQRELRALLEAVRRRAPAARIAINGLPPMQRFPALPPPLKHVLGLRARQLDDAMAEVVTDFEGVVRIPIEFDDDPARFAPDGYHPGEAGCAELAGHVAEALLNCPVKGSARS